MSISDVLKSMFSSFTNTEAPLIGFTSDVSIEEIFTNFPFKKDISAILGGCLHTNNRYTAEN